MRVEDIAFVSALRLGTGSKQKNLAQVAPRGVEPSAGSSSEGGDLRGAGLHQIGEVVNAVDGKNVTAVAGSCDEAPALIEPESVDEIFVRSPQP